MPTIINGQESIPKDFGIEVASGRVPGYKKVNKFGETENADSGVATDVWEGSTTQAIWVPPTAARIHGVVSSSVIDSDVGGVVAQGAGLRTVRIWGLKTWNSPESSEDVVLDGTTSVNTANAYVIIHRVTGLTWGANGVNTGTISLTAATDGTLTAQIAPGQNQTQMLIYGIPSGERLEIKRLQAEIVKATGTTQRGDGELLMMTDPENGVADNTAWTNKENFLVVEAQAPWVHAYDPPKSCDGPCILKIQVTTNTNDSKVIAAMDAYLVNI